MQWEFLGDVGATPGFAEKSGIGVVSGDCGPQKAFAQIATLKLTCTKLATSSGAEHVPL